LINSSGEILCKLIFIDFFKGNWQEFKKASNSSSDAKACLISLRYLSEIFHINKKLGYKIIALI
jgi:hypothetical protein